ncbi:hypothetical protein BDZ89DRAFT_958300 [Hymenopellis radicata]|nr:hypothetical protein BDZ89DRAFT_958300 [Hymenopellis radicata]
MVETRKRRKTWTHEFEEAIFMPEEIAQQTAPQRRKVYLSSLEAHIDALHVQLLSLGFYPIVYADLERYKELNLKTAKSMIATLDHRAISMKRKIEHFEAEVRNIEFI